MALDSGLLRQRYRRREALALTHLLALQDFSKSSVYYVLIGSTILGLARWFSGGGRRGTIRGAGFRLRSLQR